MYSWIMLALAVAAEVLSTISMKMASTHSPLLAYGLMAVLISLSFYFFSRALLTIPLAVTYAVWEGAGLFFIVLAGLLVFGEQLNTQQVVAIGVMTFGLFLVTFDKRPEA